jgi:hypothetical protein
MTCGQNIISDININICYFSSVQFDSLDWLAVTFFLYIKQPYIKKKSGVQKKRGGAKPNPQEN